MQRLRTVTSLDVSAVAGHHAMPAALLLHSEWPKLYGVLAVLSATGLKERICSLILYCKFFPLGVAPILEGLHQPMMQTGITGVVFLREMWTKNGRCMSTLSVYLFHYECWPGKSGACLT